MIPNSQEIVDCEEFSSKPIDTVDCEELFDAKEQRRQKRVPKRPKKNSLTNAPLTQTLLVVNKELFKSDPRPFLTRHFFYVIVDDSNDMTNQQSRLPFLVQYFDTPHRVLILDRPFKRSLLKIWNLAEFVCPGLLGTLEAFKLSIANPIRAGKKSRATKIELMKAAGSAILLNHFLNKITPHAKEVNSLNIIRERTPAFIKGKQTNGVTFLSTVELNYFNEVAGLLFNGDGDELLEEENTTLQDCVVALLLNKQFMDIMKMNDEVKMERGNASRTDNFVSYRIEKHSTVPFLEEAISSTTIILEHAKDVQKACKAIQEQLHHPIKAPHDSS
ncbi:hypothetical protein BLNAU_15996 [Blattamonas nauphoetae]|uniref:SNF2 N-terminal domain-containing protein n=1 Tax=Blattamonas nauphoetae TaxID=2049346 RepID=A0ABQ9XFK4_9EUKA|nr:hypothetical protein BLNAU_15996 [Blattamonas nauphoetae]